MKLKGSITKVWLLLLWGVAAGLSGRAQTAQTTQTTQTIILHGLIKDSTTHAPLSNASIAIKGLHGGVRTNAEGRFHLTTPQHALDITVTNVGYNPFSLHLDSVPAWELVISLSRNFNQLSAATVRNKKQKYRNKDNPAVELIRKVIANKAKNRMESYPYASYEKYEKLQVSVDKATETRAAKNKLLKPYHFLVENGDTSKLEGRTLSPVYLEETLSDVYYRKEPSKTKTIVLGKKKVDFGEFFDMRGISAFLNRLYQDFNVYDNNISVFTNLFLSPVADGGPTFYEYYIQDTVMLDSQKLVRLSFRPRNPNDFLFRGTMWITLDGNYSIQKLRLLVSKSINFNLVRDMKIDQDFEKMPNGRYLLSKSDVLADFGITQKGLGIFGERTVSFKDFNTSQPIPDSVFKGPPLVLPDSAETLPDSFWVDHRHDTLTRAETKVYANIDSLVKMKSYRRLVDWGTLLLAGYKQAGIFEIGPASTFYSFNPVEGFRLRFGGRTTTHLSTRYYSEAYAAYGFGDQKWKYFLSGTYSLNNKSIYSYPQNYIRASYQKDTKIPGQELQFVQEDNFLLSFKEGPNDKWLYNNIFRLQYLKEFSDHFSYNFGFKYWQQQPAGSIAYVKSDFTGQDTLKTITTTELSAEFRWAPHEQFYIGKLYRVPIFNKYPILDFRYIAGIKGLAGGEYNYHNLDFNIFKRFYESQLGYTDVTMDFGYLIGKVPFALANIAHANQTYAYQLQSYNLMDFLEFVSDHYATAYVDHYFNGFFFNKIPLLKKLKWREVIEAKVLWGGLRAENDPNKNPSQVQFPLTNGQVETFALTRTPYIEGGFAIANIFKLIRIDFIKRFTYLNHPDIPNYGIRFRARFDF
jgi:Family of unknown function (DUF5686)/CarboxypepD_reg-like domain